MLPFGYNPKNYGGRIWWNENNPGMRAIWGSQTDYDKHIQQGGTWKEYEDLAKKRMIALKSISEETEKQQENNKYTMEDIAQFLIDYKECNKYNSKEWLINIPIIGSKLYEKVILENMKRTFLENAYNEAKNSSIEKQNEFIMEMTPVLDDFYSTKEKNKISKR